MTSVQFAAARSVLAFIKSWRAYALIALIAVLSSAAGTVRMPVMDADEARFAQASRQMVESGDLIHIRLQERERNRKPAGIYWLQAASAAAFEPVTGRLNDVWAYRLPSVIGAALAALATLWAGTALIGRRAAFLGAALLGAGLLFGFEGMTAKTDAVLLGFTTLALAALARLRAMVEAHRGARARRLALVFWAAIGCGVLIKGPVAPMVAGLTLIALFAWERRAAWMKPLLWWAGPALALLLVLPWAIAIGVETDGRFFATALGSDLAAKAAGGDHRHGGVFGYYLLLLPLLIFPATYALPALARFFAGRPHPLSRPGVRFLIAWALPTLLVFELFPAKLVHYVLPVLPPVALLCGAALLAAARGRWRGAHVLGVVLFGVAGAIIAAAISAGLISLAGIGAEAWRAGLLIGAVALAGVIALAFARGAPARAAALATCALALSFSVRDVIVPSLRALYVSGEAAAELARTPAAAHSALWVVGYDEPSLVFLTRTSARLASAERVGAEARAGDALIVEGRQLTDVSAALARRDLAFSTRLAPVEGMSMSDSEFVDLYVGAVAPSPSTHTAALATPATTHR